MDLDLLGLGLKLKCFFSLSLLLNITFGLMKLTNYDNYGDWYDCEDCEDCEDDWGLFVVLDEEEKKQVNYKKMLLKNIIQIETIEEGECEYELEETYGNKFEYYRNAADRIVGDRIGVQDVGDRDRDVGDRIGDGDGDVEDGDGDGDDYKNIVKEKIQFLLTYMFTASVSIALIILTLTI